MRVAHIVISPCEQRATGSPFLHPSETGLTTSAKAVTAKPPRLPIADVFPTKSPRASPQMVLRPPNSEVYLPEGWKELVSRSTGHVYYGNMHTGETTWVRPLKPAGPLATAGSQESAANDAFAPVSDRADIMQVSTEQLPVYVVQRPSCLMLFDMAILCSCYKAQRPWRWGPNLQFVKVTKHMMS